jgi:hypothetical protein
LTPKNIHPSVFCVDTVQYGGYRHLEGNALLQFTTKILHLLQVSFNYVLVILSDFVGNLFRLGVVATRLWTGLPRNIGSISSRIK